MSLFNAKRVFSICLILLVGLSLIGLQTGCAQTVTEKNDQGRQIQFEITLEGTPSTQYDYYVLINNSSFEVSEYFQPNFYFFSPGLVYNDTYMYQQSNGSGLGYYYENYFSKWSDFLRLSPSTQLVNLHNGPFPASSNVSTNTHEGFVSNRNYTERFNRTTPLIFTLPLSFVSEISETLYFTILVVAPDSPTQGNIMDVLDSIKSIQIRENETREEVDSDVGVVSPAANILSWKIRVI